MKDYTLLVMFLDLGLLFYCHSHLVSSTSPVPLFSTPRSKETESQQSTLLHA